MEDSEMWICNFWISEAAIATFDFKECEMKDIPSRTADMWMMSDTLELLGWRKEGEIFVKNGTKNDVQQVLQAQKSKYLIIKIYKAELYN